MHVPLRWNLSDHPKSFICRVRPLNQGDGFLPGKFFDGADTRHDQQPGSSLPDALDPEQIQVVDPFQNDGFPDAGCRRDLIASAGRRARAS